MTPWRWAACGRKVALALFATSLFWACASSPEGELGGSAQADTAAVTLECATGTVVAEGVPVAPRTLVRQEDGVAVELLGTFAGNVRRLAATVVRACGPGRTSDGSLEVTTVTLLEVDGMPAILGTLRAAISGWVLDPLDGGDPVILAAVPERLQAADGEVVWVAGLATPDTLTVRTFGVLEGWR